MCILGIDSISRFARSLEFCDQLIILRAVMIVLTFQRPS